MSRQVNDSDRHWRGTAFVGALMVLVAIGVYVFGGQLLPTLGIIAVGAGLFLPPRQTIALAVLAVALAGFLLLALQINHPGARLGNVALASGLAVLASWTMNQRMKSIRELNHTQTTIFASVADGLAVLSADGTILQLNQALTRLVPHAGVGQHLHPLLGHILADGSACQGGCLLDRPDLTVATSIVEGESITGAMSRLDIEYTTAPVSQTTAVLCLRDVSALKESEQDRRSLVEAVAREGELQHVLEALGAPAYTRAPAVDGVQLDLYSVPTAAESPSGGDLVDVTPLSDGRVLVMIADALGDRVLSVRDASRVLYTARAFVEAGVCLDEVVTRTATTLSTHGQAPDVSLMVAVVDPDRGQLDLVGGGHPPALLVRENGASEWLESDGPGVGQQPPTALHVVSRQMTPADSLVLYTDGVIDGSQDVIQGLSLLRSTATALRKRPVEGWARSVTEVVLPPGQTSVNGTVLLVRLDGDSGSRQTTAIR